MKKLGLGFFGCGLLLVARCYSPDLSGVLYSCDGNNPYCPDGQMCIAGACRAPGMVVDDGGTGMPGDMLMSAAGCKSGTGFAVGTMSGTVFACPGLFNTNNGDQIPPADQLCNTGYKICTDATMVDQTTCKTLTGFFAAQVPVKHAGPNLTCGTSNMPLFGGCGRSAPAVDALTGGAVCAGFTQAIDCIAETRWDCNNQSNLTGVSNTNAADGVLCCKMP